MGRRPGSRNADYEETRARLLTSLRPIFAETGGLRLSARELAARAGVEPRTLKHYFGDRDGILKALFENDHRIGEPGLMRVGFGPLGPVRESLRGTLEYIRQGFARGGLADVHVVGIGAGISQKPLGEAYLQELLEPTLQSMERRIERHQAAGDLAPGSARYAALELLGSALMVFLHQHTLGGRTCRPLDEGAFLDELVDHFLTAHAPEAPARKTRTRTPRPPHRAKP
jgi:AcrR family transcriptional regulator